MKNWTYNNFTIHQFEKLESTNKMALEKAMTAQIFDREIIMADEQSAGRGRINRVWSSPKGNLYFSLVLQPKILAVCAAQISFVAIVALRQTIESLVNNANLTENASKKANINSCDAQKIIIQNKWPNDLLINEKKIAGILLEGKNNQENCEFVVLGIGVNIESNPDNTVFAAANLKQFNIEITKEILLQKFLENFEKQYQNWLDFGFVNIRKAFLQKAYRLKQKITVNNNGEKIEGIFEDIDKDGALILSTALGTKKIFAGDVFDLLR